MASFDFIDATNKGYFFVWKNRALVAKLASVPIFVKFACYLAVAGLDVSDNVLRSGLILLPSIFLEGWMVTNLLRIAFFSDLGIIVTGDPERDGRALRNKSKDLMAGTIIYVLLKMWFFVLLGVLDVDPEMAASGKAASVSTQEPSVAMFMLALATLYALLWLFRVYFLYIPVTLGYSLKAYFKKLVGISSSFHLLAAYLMCFLPLVLLLVLGFDLLGMVMGGADNFSNILGVVGMAWKSCIEVMIEAVAALVLGHGVIMMMNDKKNGKGAKGPK